MAGVRGWLTPGRKAMQSVKRRRKLFVLRGRAGRVQHTCRTSSFIAVFWYALQTSCRFKHKRGRGNDSKAKVTEQFTMRQLLLIIYGCVLLIVSVTMPCRASNRMALLGNKALLL